MRQSKSNCCSKILARSDRRVQLIGDGETLICSSGEKEVFWNISNEMSKSIFYLFIYLSIYLSIFIIYNYLSVYLSICIVFISIYTVYLSINQTTTSVPSAPWSWSRWRTLTTRPTSTASTSSRTTTQGPPGLDLFFFSNLSLFLFCLTERRNKQRNFNNICNIQYQF